MLKRFLGLSIGLLLVFLVFSMAMAEGNASIAIDNGSAVCTNRLQLRRPQRCANGTARNSLTVLASAGLYPEHPFPVGDVDLSLGQVDFTYLRSGRKDGTPLYNSLDSVIKGRDAYRTIEPGFVYFSWIDRIEQDGKVAYMIAPGVYIRGDGVSRVSIPNFRGVTLTHTPTQPFGWVMTNVETRLGPGSEQAKTGRWKYRYDMVWIFDVESVGGLDWYKVGPEDWIEQRLLAIVFPDTTRPEGVPDDHWISINLYEQTMMVYESGEMIYATLVSTGLIGWWTQPGDFQVYKKLERDFMGGAFEADRSDYYYLEDVPWILYFDESRALHGAYWHNGFGYPRSHGCVNLSLPDAHWIYNWAEVGTWVHVFDPSGETPTDPSQYGAGGV